METLIHGCLFCFEQSLALFGVVLASLISVNRERKNFEEREKHLCSEHFALAMAKCFADVL